MGVYLSTPNTEKISDDQTGKKLNYGASTMQGWRMSQEDAHNCILEFDDDTALFAVYDGHGGAEVAQYCASYLPQFIKDGNSYKQGKIAVALEESFLGFDEKLTTQSVIKELKVMAGVESDEEETPMKKKSEAELLRQEADMPIEELMAKYENTETIQPRTRILRKKVQVNSPVIKSKKLPYPADGNIKSSQSNENSNVNIDDKITNGHAENENNINLEKENQMSSVSSSSSSSSSQQNNLSKTEDCSVNSANISSEITASHQSASSTSSSLLSHDKSSPLKEEADSSTEKDGQSSFNKTGSNIGCSSSSSKDTTEKVPVDEGSSSRSSLDSKQTKEPCNEGTTQETLQEVESTSQDEEEEGGASSSGVFKGSTRRGEIIDSVDEEEGEDIDYSGSEDEDEDVEFDSEDEEEEEESEEEDDDVEEVDDLCMEEHTNTEEPGSDSGSTAVLALIKEKQIFVANVGDSRCILCREGKAVDLSFDHKPEDESEKNRIEAAGGKVTEEGRINGGLNLSRALGDHFYKKNTSKSAKEQMITAFPDIETATLQDNDEFLVLACDGIWNSLTSQEVVDFVKEKLKEEENQKQLSRICEQLFDKCLAPNTMGDGTGCDNMTCIIVTFNKNLNNNKNKRQAEDNEEHSDKRRKTDDNSGS